MDETAPARTRPSNRQGLASPVGLTRPKASPASAPLAAFSGKTPAWPELLFGPGGWAALSFGLAIASLALADAGMRQYGPVIAWQWGYPWLLVSLLCLIPAGFHAAWLFARKSFKLSIYPDGLLLQRPLRRPLTIPWSKLRGVAHAMHKTSWANSKSPPRHSAWLVLQTGQSLLLSERIFGAALPEIVTHIKARLYPRLLPELRAGLRDGKWLHFGAASLHRTQIHLRGGKPSGWGGVRRVTVANGWLVVELTNAAFQRQPVANIPNIELLLQLVREEIAR